MSARARVVVVGCSLGGMRALEVVLRGLAPDFPLPIAVVQHRGTEWEGQQSQLARLLQLHSAIPVAEAGDKDPLVGGHVYLAPPDYHLLAIGASTGGPNALGALLPALGHALAVPIVIVQHMPPLFTRFLAERLSAKGGPPVREAVDGDGLAPGFAWIAPGDWHMRLENSASTVRIRLDRGPHVHSCRPSVDVLFESVADVFGSGVLGVVLTGMGQDGLRGCERLVAAGSRVLVQDEASSVVWGMPGMVARANLADRVLPLDQLGNEILQRIARANSPRRKAA